MDLQNLAYALTQVVHNFGAVAVIGAAVFGRWARADQSPIRKRLAWVILIGWSLQAASGMGFGAISYAYYGRLPDIHGVAVAALYVKVACAAAGIALSAAFILRHARLMELARARLWSVQILLGAAALTAAAFLRWFS